MVMIDAEVFYGTIAVILIMAAFRVGVWVDVKDTVTVFNDIIEWNKARNNLEFNPNNEYEMLKEELEEFGEADNEIDGVDALCDLIVVATGALFKLGYDPEKCMNEVIKHISSRKQDPAQKEIWEKWGASGKWQKDRSQPKEDLYQPKFEECKL